MLMNKLGEQTLECDNMPSVVQENIHEERFGVGIKGFAMSQDMQQSSFGLKFKFSGVLFHSFTKIKVLLHIMAP